MTKLELKIGYLPIIDHLILGLSEKRDNSSFKHVDVKPVRFHSWPELGDALERGEINSAFITSPYAIFLRSSGVPIKAILLSHREGLGFIVDEKISSLKSISGKTIGIPHKYSTHSILLHKYLSENGMDYFNDIKIAEIAPPDFVSSLENGSIAGYFGSEPFGAQAEHKLVGKIEVMSKDIKKHHIDCIVVFREETLDNKEAIQEFTDSLVSSGIFMYEKPLDASKMGAGFLEQSQMVLYEVLNEKKRRVSSWDLLPVKAEFEEMQDDMINVMHMTNKKINIEEFVDETFAQKSYEYLTLKAGADRKRKKLKEKIVLPSAVFVLAALLWQGIASLGVFPASLLPSPFMVLTGLAEVAEKGILFTHVFASLYRVFAGFIIAAIFGIPIGLLLGSYKKSRYAFEPLIQLIRPISPIAWIPLAILWFGVGDNPAIFIIFITAFFPILLASQAAVKNIDIILIKTATNFGTKGKNMIKKVILPASFPNIMVGIRIALGISWVIIVAAEMVGMSSGLGFMILDARNFLRTDLVIAGMLVIGLIGIGLDRLLSYFENKVNEKWSYKMAPGL